MELAKHYLDVIRQLGQAAIVALICLNGIGAFLVWLPVLMGKPASTAVIVPAYCFLGGLLAAFAAIVVTWLIAQWTLAQGTAPVPASWALWAMILLPVLSFAAFTLGYSASISAAEIH